MSNLSDIGFPTPDETAINEMIMHVIEVAKPVQTQRGLYLVYGDPSGAEIYLQGNFEQELVGFNPHFSGKSRRRVTLTDLIERESSELDGGYQATNDGDDEPFVFDLPDFRSTVLAELPQTVEIQLTAFGSNDFRIFRTANDYQAAQESDYEYATRMFVAVGLQAFDPKDGKIDLAAVRPVAKFAGEVVECETRRNELSGEEFNWMLVDTQGGLIDVVVDPKYVPFAPRPGFLVSGTFWLSGRIL